MEPVTKRSVLEKSLQQGLTTIILSTRIDGVSLPAHLMEPDHCKLNLSYRFKDVRLEIDEHKIEADLSFNKKVFTVIVPWDSVLVIIDSQGNHHNFNSEIDMAVKEVFATAQKTKPEEKAKFEVILDRTEELKLELIQGGGNLTPPVTGHLRLLKN